MRAILVLYVYSLYRQWQDAFVEASSLSEDTRVLLSPPTASADLLITSHHS
jgi:hypothetical protein